MGVLLLQQLIHGHTNMMVYLHAIYGVKYTSLLGPPPAPAWDNLLCRGAKHWQFTINSGGSEY